MRRPRRGLTLYEVLLALAILLPSLAVLSHSITSGARAAVQARLQTQAILRCDSLISEMIAGVRPMEAASNAGFDDGALGWSWSVAIAGGPHPDLLALQATVEHVDSNGVVNASYALTRYVRDPQLFIDAASLEAMEAMEAEAQP